MNHLYLNKSNFKAEPGTPHVLLQVRSWRLEWHVRLVLRSSAGPRQEQDAGRIGLRAQGLHTGRPQEYCKTGEFETWNAVLKNFPPDIIICL